MADISEHPKKAAFLAAYANCGVIKRACKAADVGRTTHYEWMQDDPEYAEAFAEAHKTAVETLEAEAVRRAIHGWKEPVFHRGSICGHVRKFSDTLLIFLLKGAAPHKYRERMETTHSGAIAHEHSGSISTKESVEALLGNPDYAEFLRHRERNSDPRLICTNGHAGNGKPVDDGPSRNGH